MAVYWKLKSAKDFDPTDCISVSGSFISVLDLKTKVYLSKRFGEGLERFRNSKYWDKARDSIEVCDAQTNEVYDETAMIPKFASVLIRRIPPGHDWSRKTITIEKEVKAVEDRVEEDTFPSSGMTSTLLAPKTRTDEVDEETKIKIFVNTPALKGAYFTGDSGICVPKSKIPPPGYICHRCKVPGHFIQHCSTNGDRSYDLKRFRTPTGIPKSMLLVTQDGSYQLSSGVAAVLKPNEAAFDKEIEGIPSASSPCDLPPELFCELCKQVMKDAVLCRKCCFNSFCDTCIRDHIISKSMCFCGAKNVLADDLIPNKALRATINSILLTRSTSSSSNTGSSTISEVGGVSSQVSGDGGASTFTSQRAPSKSHLIHCEMRDEKDVSSLMFNHEMKDQVEHHSSPRAAVIMQGVGNRAASQLGKKRMNYDMHEPLQLSPKVHPERLPARAGDDHHLDKRRRLKA